MKNILNAIQITISAIGGYIGWFLGGWDGFLYALVTFVIIDYITGVMAAIIERRLSSEVGFRGIIKKVLIFVMVAVANIVDTQLIHNGSAVRTAVTLFYISNEGISILENTAKTGLPVPKKLKDYIEQMNNREDK